MKEKIFVTGSNGQLGRELIKQMGEGGLAFAGYDVPEIDITDYESARGLVIKENPSVIINCAAMTNVNGCEQMVEEAYAVNGEGAGNMARIAAELEIPIVHVSTDYVFDGNGIEENGELRPYVESDEVAPVSVYGKSKAAGEKAVMDATDKYFIVRTAWLYGDGANFVKTMLNVANKLAQNPEAPNKVEVVNDQFGSPTSTVDLAKAILKLIETESYGIYHGTCEGITNWNEFTKTFYDLAGLDTEVAAVTSEEYEAHNPQSVIAPRPKYSVLENKGLKDLGINVFRPWQEAIKEYISETMTKPKMKGIILAGGSGTRLYPITKAVSKQLLPIYDKPMIYYPLSILMHAGIRDILIITTPEDNEGFQRLLGDGSQFGLNLKYAKQDKPEGLAQAFPIAADPDLENPLTGEKFGPFITKEDCVALVLGDNIFYGNGFVDSLKNAVANAVDNGEATIFGYWVKDWQRYGVVGFDKDGKVNRIQEKPQNYISNYAIPGLYFFTGEVIDISKGVKKSERADGSKEYEITSVIEGFKDLGKLRCEVLGRGIAWLDTGTTESLMEASNFVATIQNRQGLYIACLEEIAYEKGYISEEDLKKVAKEYGKNDYGEYLSQILERGLNG